MGWSLVRSATVAVGVSLFVSLQPPGSALNQAPLGLVASCSTPTTVVIEGPQTFTTPQTFSDLDALTLRNVTFTNITGAAVNISGVGSVTIEGCTFTHLVGTSGGAAAITGRSNGTVVIQSVTMDDIVGHAIKFPDSSEDDASLRTGSIVIDGVSIHDVRRMDGVEGSGNGITLSAADAVMIENSDLSDIADWGIKLGHENSKVGLRLGEEGGVSIEGNDISDVMGDGILVNEGTYNVSVVGNRIWNIATDGRGARPSHGDHGIYYQCNVDGRISDNHIWNVFDSVGGDPSLPNGIGISYRSGDVLIARNHVHDISKNGIAYFSDHPGSGTVRIESNLVYDTGMGGIYLAGALGPDTNPSREEVDRHEIYGNTVYMESSLANWSNVAPIGWYNLSEPCEVLVWGNLTVLDNGDEEVSHHVFDGASAPSTAFPPNEWPGQEGQVFVEQNLRLPHEHPLEGVFSNPAGDDYTLAPASPAIGFAPILDGLVTTDLGGQPRSAPSDAGAWELSEAAARSR